MENLASKENSELKIPIEYYQDEESQRILYAIGYEDGHGGVGMAYGPTPDLAKARMFRPLQNNAIMFEFIKDQEVEIGRWNVDTEQWDFL